jgi:hypothetical protein
MLAHMIHVIQLLVACKLPSLLLTVMTETTAPLIPVILLLDVYTNQLFAMIMIFALKTSATPSLVANSSQLSALPVEIAQLPCAILQVDATWKLSLTELWTNVVFVMEMEAPAVMV